MKSFIKTVLAAFIGTVLALGICVFIIVGLIGSIATRPAQVMPKSAILKIDFGNPITEQSTDGNFKIQGLELSTSSTLGIYKAVKSIEAAAYDPSIQFIYINPQEVNCGIANLEELRNALEQFKASGKPIVAYCSNYTQAAYYLCSVADKIYIDKNGLGELLGLGANMMFFKNIISKIGLDVQLIKHGKFKAAAEQFVNQDISPENRYQNEEMLNSMWDVWVKAICESRNINPDELNNWINNLELLSANSFVEKGLIDQAVTHEEMAQILCTLASVNKEKDLNFVSLKQYGDTRIKTNLKIKDKIAVLYADGDITMDGEKGITASKFYPLIKEITEDSTIKAVVLRVNSPGGDAQAAEIINNSLQELRQRKPLIVSFSNYAASGGYWISAKSDYIFTDATTITGSIGVFSLAVTYGNALKKNFDINTVTIQTNANSSMAMGVNKLNETQIKAMENMVEDIYGQFISLVAQGRNMNVSQVDSIGQGRVWTGAQAINVNLANSIGGLDDAIEYAKNLAGISQARIKEYPVLESQYDKFMKMLTETSVAVKTIADPASVIEASYSYLKDKNNCFVTFARLPYVYDIR